MLVGLLLSAAMSATWAPSSKFSLVCSGTQTGYVEQTPSGPAPNKLSIPWLETFTVDLTKGTYCSQGCARPEPISALSATAMDLAKTSLPETTSLKHFDVTSGSYQSAEVTGDLPQHRFHLEKTGTCTIKP